MLGPGLPHGRLGVHQSAFVFQGLKNGIAFEGVSFVADESFQEPSAGGRGLERGFVTGIIVPKELSIGQIEHRPFGRRNGVIIHPIALSSRFQCTVELRTTADSSGIGRRMKLGQSFQIDVEFVQIEPAVRRIGAQMMRPAILERVQRIDAHESGSQVSARPFDQITQIREIACPPIRG